MEVGFEPVTAARKKIKKQRCYPLDHRGIGEKRAIVTAIYVLAAFPQLSLFFMFYSRFE